MTAAGGTEKMTRAEMLSIHKGRAASAWATNMMRVRSARDGSKTLEGEGMHSTAV